MVTTIVTEPEISIYRALSKIDVVFEFKSSIMGEAVFDFYVPEYGIAISVINSYSGNKAQDALQQIGMESQYGIKLIYITEEMALRNASFYTKEALAGRDHSDYGVW